jgi:hypothetical protein
MFVLHSILIVQFKFWCLLAPRPDNVVYVKIFCLKYIYFKILKKTGW